MTVRRLLFPLAFTMALLVAAVPADAGPAPDDQASRTRPESGQSGSSGGAHGAQPRSAPSQPPATAQRTPQAQPRGNDPDRQLGTRRPEADRSHGRFGGRFRGDHTIYWGPYWYPWGGWWGWGWWPHYPWGYYGNPVRYYPYQVRESMGALDLDLRPEETQVFLNGQPIGIADNFDGWPRYLWLDEGTYDLVFYHEGYETLARQYSIYPGVVIDVEDRMTRGEATPPEEYFPEAPPRTTERREEERGEPADRDAPGWQERVREDRERFERDEEEREAVHDARSEPVQLSLEVTPPDAAIYLDGRFVGSADEITADGARMIVDPGEHELEVVRPGYESKRLTFSGESGESVELTVELAKME